MGAVNRFPQGLLGLFSAKTTGRTPANASEVVGLNVDLGPYYLASINLSQAVASVSTGSRGEQLARVDIPAGETWQVISVTSQVYGQSNGDTAWIHPCFTNVPGGGVNDIHPVGNGSDAFTYALSVAGDSYARSAMLPYPIICRAPVGFCTKLGKVQPVASVTIETSVMYYQLD